MSNFRLNILLSSLILLFLGACNGGNDQSTDSNSSNKVASAATMPGDSVLLAYLQIKDALVQTDGNAAQKAALKLQTLIRERKIDNDTLRLETDSLVATNNIKLQRNYFSSLSSQIYKYAQKSTDKGVLYQQFCPMAQHFKGAIWLSTEAKIQNPYFGSKMMDCGSVQDTLK